MITAVADITLPTTDDLRTFARTSLQRCGVNLAVLETAAKNSITTRTPVTGDDTVRLCRPPTPADVEGRDRPRTTYAFLTWRTVPAPVRGALVKRLGELLTEHKDDWPTWSPSRPARSAPRRSARSRR